MRTKKEVNIHAITTGAHTDIKININHREWKSGITACFRTFSDGSQESPHLQQILLQPECTQTLIKRVDIVKTKIIGKVQHDEFMDESIDKFAEALPSCLPFTFAFRPGDPHKSFCPLSRPMGGWHNKYDLNNFIREESYCDCKNQSSKQMMAHLEQMSSKCPLHKCAFIYINKVYQHYYGYRLHHHALISSKRHNSYYNQATRFDKNYLS